MRTAPAPPYLIPPAEAVSGHPWTLPDGRPVADRFEHWDPFTDLEFVRRIDVDVSAVCAACGLGADATVALVASWFSSRTRLGAASPSVEFGAARGTIRAAVELAIPGASTGGRLKLVTALVLRSSGSDDSPVSPRREGAILWTDEVWVALEGTGARFPISAVAFSQTERFPEEAGWALEWHGADLEAPILGSLRLLVNAEDRALLGALRSGSSDQGAQLVRAFVMLDVAKTLVHTGLRNEMFISDPDVFAPESVGRMLRELMAACWPGVPVAALAVRLEKDPSRLDAELQAYLGVLR